MYKRYFKNNEICLKFIGNDTYFEKDNIILDKTCPKCNKILIDEFEFCDCGYYLKAAKNSTLWSLIISVWLIIGIFVFITILNVENFSKLSLHKFKYHSESLNSLSHVNIQVITSLKDSYYKDCIQYIYTKPKQDNELVILVKPMMWNIMSPSEKKNLLSQMDKNWKSLYKQYHPVSSKKPVVSFANNMD